MSKAKDALRAISGSVDAGKPTVIPSLPVAPSSGNSTVDQFMSAVKQTLETWAGKRGDTLDSAVTWRELVNKKLASIDLAGVGAGVGAGGSAGAESIIPLDPNANTDFTPPPAPTDLTATGAMATIILDWSIPAYSNHSHTEVWRSGEPSIGTAVKIATAPGTVYADSVGGGHSYYYWVRCVSTADVTGPYNQTDGVFGETALDSGYILDVLNGQIRESELNKSLSARIDLIDGPASTPGTVAALIEEETNARTEADSAISETITTLSATVGTVAALIEEETNARTEADSAISETITTLSATVANNDTTYTSAIETLAKTTAGPNGATAQYTVKTDVNGYVSGFGLSSTSNTAGVGTSQFIFKADQFAFGAPGQTSVYPFVIQATATTVNGEAVPAGVYIDAAYIKNGTITSAKIGSVAADKISAGYITAGIAMNSSKVYGAELYSGGTTTTTYDANNKVIGFTADNPSIQIAGGNADFNVGSFRINNSGTLVTPFEVVGGLVKIKNAQINMLTADMIDTRGLSIKDASGNIILAAGTALDWSNVGGDGKPNLSNSSTSGEVYNGNCTQIAEDGRPAGIYASYGGATKSILSFQDTAKSIVKLYSATDSSIGCSFSAFRVSPGTAYKVFIRVKASAAATSGFYFRMYEYDSELPNGVFYISNATGESGGVTGTRSINSFRENQPIGTAWEEYTFTYTPTATAKWACPQFLNWTGMGFAELHIDKCVVTNSATVGATFGVNVNGQIDASSASTYIANGAIQNAQIGNIIQSSNFVAGSAGWRIDKAGSAEFSAGNFRGDITGATGTFTGTLAAGTVDLGSLVGSTYTFATAGSTNTLYVPDGYTSMRVTMVGAGGGGGAGHWGEWEEVAGVGGGGGAGEYIVAAWDNLTVGATVTIRVGAGGAGGNPSSGPGEYDAVGGAGGDSYINLAGARLKTARGGGGGSQGGVYVGPNNNTSYGNWAGGAGGDGGGNAANGTSTGIGGSTVWGSGGTNPSNTSNGTSGSGFGSGGGGGGYGSVRAAEIWPNYTIYNGGAGAGGKVIVEFYNPNAVVLRSEHTELENRVNTIETGQGGFWVNNKNMTQGAIGSLVVAQYGWFNPGGGWSGVYGWNADGNYLPGAQRYLGGFTTGGDYSVQIGLFVRYA